MVFKLEEKLEDIESRLSSLESNRSTNNNQGKGILKIKPPITLNNRVIEEGGSELYDLYSRIRKEDDDKIAVFIHDPDVGAFELYERMRDRRTFASATLDKHYMAKNVKGDGYVVIGDLKILDNQPGKELLDIITSGEEYVINLRIMMHSDQHSENNLIPYILVLKEQEGEDDE